MSNKRYSKEQLEAFRRIVDPKTAALKDAQPAELNNPIPAYQDLNRYPVNKELSPTEFKNIQQKRDADFKQEREMKLKELQEEKANKLSETKKRVVGQPTLLSGNQSELIWIGETPPPSNLSNAVVSHVSDQSSIQDLENELEQINNEMFIVDESTSNEVSSESPSSRLPNEGEYCIVKGGDILFITSSLEDLKEFIMDLLQKDDSLELTHLNVMKRLCVSFDLMLKE